MSFLSGRPGPTPSASTGYVTEDSGLCPACGRGLGVRVFGARRYCLPCYEDLRAHVEGPKETTP